MAEHRAVRSSTRRITPQPQLASVAPPSSRGSRIRTTRSQSQDVEAATTAQRQTITGAARRGARHASVESVGSMDSRSGKPARSSRRTRTAPVGDLTTVEEDEVDRLPVLPLMVEGEITPPPQPAEDISHRSPGALSNISGTTAISTTLSNADAEGLDSELILNNLEDLHRQSEQLLQIIAPNSQFQALQNIVKNMKIPGSKISRNFSSRDKQFLPCLENFTSRSIDYVSPHTVLKALFSAGSIDDIEPVRPDDMCYKANLAIFAKRMLTMEREHEEAWVALRNLDMNFPAPFLSAFETSATESNSLPGGTSCLYEETFSLALDHRTQFAILVLSRGQNEHDFDPEEALARVFYESQGEDIIRGWGVSGLGANGAELPKKLQDAVRSRVREIRNYFSNDGGYFEIEPLGSDYVWSDFVARVLTWISLRNAEIEKSLKQSGGIGKLVHNLRHACVDSPADETVDRTAPEQTPQKHRSSNDGSNKRTSSARRSGTRRALNYDGVRLVAQLSKRASLRNAPDDAAGSISQAPPQDAGYSAQDDDWQPAIDDDDDRREETPVIGPPRSTAEAVSAIRRVEKQNKENPRRIRDEATTSKPKSFVDRQSDAERVQFGDGFDASQKPGLSFPREEAARREAKRKRPETIEEDSSDEEAFQHDDRPINGDRRRQEAPPRKKRGFLEEDEIEPGQSGQAGLPRLSFMQEVEREVSQSSQAHGSIRVWSDLVAREPVRAAQPRNVFHDIEQGEDVGERFPAASTNEAIRQVNRFRTAVKPRRQFVRKAWSLQEEEALTDAIGTYGCQWRMILEMHKDVFVDRSNVDLKDKARNLKMEYLKARCGLPKGFENVPLGASYEAKLRARGIDI